MEHGTKACSLNENPVAKGATGMIKVKTFTSQFVITSYSIHYTKLYDFPASAEALSDSELLFFPKRPFIDLLERERNNFV